MPRKKLYPDTVTIPEIARKIDGMDERTVRRVIVNLLIKPYIETQNN